ncbi:hypothetical protein LOC67_23180 [Stieleria sp. JC731]|uniref:hypothetical protein n=1 Tax=Pirellulaceae TaxID=2691357 RepID=UPI001E5ECE1E|nr:hypothetical protein [Stieleria sp. JC731]MCC9603463.1 hypothetical protein [Stieleria sp. JC731]
MSQSKRKGQHGEERIEQWRIKEWECILERRKRAHQSDQPAPGEKRPKHLVGLALSGGGIRSALYNDGFLQGLSHRGFLRYCDYLCSVSGGGYIAGHLSSQFRPKSSDEHDRSNSESSSEHSFHDDPKRNAFGRDPETGRFDQSRLAGIGGYLSRPLVFIPAYLWSFFFSLAFYLGAAGVIAALAALFWRTFDNVQFREIYGGSLGLYQYGDELLVAFLPFFILFVLMVIFEAGISLHRLIVGFEDENVRRIHNWFRAGAFLLLLFAILSSIAIYLGNGKSNVRGGTEMIYLNKYAQYFAIAAAGIQIIVFLGRDRLFRSERGEAKSWQRHVQHAVTTVLVMFLLFSIIHWMGREDISGYTRHRDPYLVAGDVQDWPRLWKVVGSYESVMGISSSQPESLEDVNSNPILTPSSTWQKSLAISRLGMFGRDSVRSKDFSRPPPPTAQSDEEITKVWSLPRRVAGAAYAYVTCVLFDNESAGFAGPFLPIDQERNRYKVLRGRQLNDLAAINKHLGDQRLTTFLIYQLTPSGQSFSTFPKLDANFPGALPAQLSTLLDSDEALLSRGQKELMITVCRTVLLPTADPKSNESSIASQASEASQADLAKVNRLLLESIYPTMIQKYDIASTLVVPYFDQITRKRWLVFWSLLFLFGLVGGLGPHRIGTVFQFYRRQLSSNFLVPTWNRKRSVGDMELSDIKSYQDGLPYPLILAASLAPSLRNGSYRVSTRPFLFTPHFSGSFEDGEVPIPSQQVSFSRSPDSPAITLGDAVTLSGAAVTPLMSENRWLSIILDFFNTGIGQRVRRTDRTGIARKIRSQQPVLVSGIAGLLTIGLSIWLLEFYWSSIPVAAAAFLFCYCWVQRIGSPELIRSLTFAENSDQQTGFNSRRSFYVADGGYQDYLGVSELLRRRCDLIVVSDAGANIGGDSLGTLARMCEQASRDHGVRFLDLDHEAPIDFGRLEINEDRLVHQPFICMRVRYPSNQTEKESKTDKREGLLVYCQMSITESDPIEIKHIRNLFPSFPDEPTVNQFYNDKQVAAYRTLGYHIATRLCNELNPWSDGIAASQSSSPDSTEDVKVGTSPTEAFDYCLRQPGSVIDSRQTERVSSTIEQPLFEVMRERLLTAYRLACYEEKSYLKDDIYSEAIWPSRTYAFPTFQRETERLHHRSRGANCADFWLRRYEGNADVRSAYRTAVINDINALGVNRHGWCGILWDAIICESNKKTNTREMLALLGAHLTCIAVASQEIHRGRPHAAFQVGGREKLIDLCERIASTIYGQRQNRDTEIQGARYGNIHDVLRDIDQIIAELIEMERSIFLGSEHVSTVSFAQCVTSAWGRVARGVAEVHGADRLDDFLLDLQEQLVADEGVLGFAADIDKSLPIGADALDLVSAEMRHQLDVGLKKIDLRRVRCALARSWCLGFLNESELQSSFHSGQAEKPPQKNNRSRGKKTGVKQNVEDEKIDDDN